MATVIIPAHNEETVLGRCLAVLLSDAQPSEFDVIVVCNACTDRTAEIAVEFADVRVVSVERASKSNALNVGDAEATSFPRVYLDADVELSTKALRSLVEALPDDVPLVGAPRLALDLEGSSLLVRLYYGAWLRLAYARDRMVGSGVYGISRAGRARFEDFPERGVDDHLIYVLFPYQDRVTSNGEFLVRPARTMRALIRVRSRMFAMNREVEIPAGAGQEIGWRKQRIWRALRERPGLAMNLFVYAATQALVRAKATHLADGGRVVWSRDETSR